MPLGGVCCFQRVVPRSFFHPPDEEVDALGVQGPTRPTGVCWTIGTNRCSTEVERSVKPAAPVLALAIVALSSCSSSDPTPTVATADAWGGLAVFDGPPSGDEALSTGTLLIEENCVVLISGTDNSRSLVVWPSEGTTWDPDSRTITYTDGESSIELANGDYFSVGGGGDNPEEGSLSAAEWAASLDGWVSKPQPACLSSVDSWWFVGGLPSESN